MSVAVASCWLGCGATGSIPALSSELDPIERARATAMTLEREEHTEPSVIMTFTRLLLAFNIVVVAFQNGAPTAHALLPSPPTRAVSMNAFKPGQRRQYSINRASGYERIRKHRHFHERFGKPYSSSSLSLSPVDASTAMSSALLISNDAVASSPLTLKSLAEGLGYLIGAGSVLLYTPIAVRIVRTKSADGLTISTWWLKIVSFTSTIVYNIRNGFPLAAFSETIVILLEAAIVLALCTYYQKRADSTTLLLAASYLSVTTWALLSPYDTFPYGPPDEWVSAAQVFATVLNTSALLPQLKQNFERRASGDYSPVTSSLASVGCAARLFTTVELAAGDPLLLLNYGVALLLNLSVLSQVIYYGTINEGKSVAELFMADVRSTDDEDDDGCGPGEFVPEQSAAKLLTRTKEEAKEGVRSFQEEANVAELKDVGLPT